MGYLDLPDKTESTLDAEGWLHSGDIAHIDSKGYVTITGRIKVNHQIKLIMLNMLYCYYYMF
jgi:long-subunit acyl-CoA synthetase (AMP-forming)